MFFEARGVQRGHKAEKFPSFVEFGCIIFLQMLVPNGLGWTTSVV